MKTIRRLERLSRPRLRFLFDHRLSNVVFGLLVVAGSAGAFLAPPFTGLDTLPALGVVLLSLGVLLEDVVVVVVALAIGVAGVMLEIVLGKRGGSRPREAALGRATSPDAGPSSSPTPRDSVKPVTPALEPSPDLAHPGGVAACAERLVPSLSGDQGRLYLVGAHPVGRNGDGDRAIPIDEKSNVDQHHADHGARLVGSQPR